MARENDQPQQAMRTQGMTVCFIKKHTVVPIAVVLMLAKRSYRALRHYGV